MNQEFKDLHAEYRKALKNNDIEIQEVILNKMRENLKKRGANVSENAPYSELLKINGELNKKETEQRFDKINNQEREIQTGKKTYNENHRYLS